MAEFANRRQTFMGWLALGICGVLVAGLLLPIFQIPHGPTRRTLCQNNLRQLALAAMQFTIDKKRFPGYQERFGTRGPEGKIGSWTITLMPYLEEQALRDIWDDPDMQPRWIKAADNSPAKADLDLFYPDLHFAVCPSDQSPRAGVAPLSYVANTGFYLLPNDAALELDIYSGAATESECSTLSQRPANGLFCNQLSDEVTDPATGRNVKVFGVAAQPVRTEDVRDGISQTLLFSENHLSLSWRDTSLADDRARLALGMVWLYAGESAAPGRPHPRKLTPEMLIQGEARTPNVTPLSARPSSSHLGVVNVGMADASVRPLSEGLDYRVYQALMTPGSRRSDVPNPNYAPEPDEFY